MESTFEHAYVRSIGSLTHTPTHLLTHTTYLPTHQPTAPRPRSRRSEEGASIICTAQHSTVQDTTDHKPGLVVITVVSCACVHSRGSGGSRGSVVLYV